MPVLKVTPPNNTMLDFLSYEGNKIVFRPDSGEHVSTTLDCLDIIGNGFGLKTTNNGYKVFDANIGLLWGDGLDYKKIRDVLLP